MQIVDFKNSIIAIQLFLVMILNMHLTSEILSQNDLKVWFCGGCASKGISDAHFPQVVLI